MHNLLVVAILALLPAALFPVQDVVFKVERIGDPCGIVSMDPGNNTGEMVTHATLGKDFTFFVHNPIPGVRYTAVMSPALVADDQKNPLQGCSRIDLSQALFIPLEPVIHSPEVQAKLAQMMQEAPDQMMRELLGARRLRVVLPGVLTMPSGQPMFYQVVATYDLPNGGSWVRSSQIIKCSH